MRLHWTPFALPGLAVLVVGLSLAWFIYRYRPDRTQNRRLALQLLVEAVVVGITGGGVWILAEPDIVRTLTLAAYMLVWPKLWTYYNFLATLETPLAEPLKAPGRLSWLLSATLLASLSVVFWPHWYAGEPIYWPAVDALHVAPGTAQIPIFWMWGVMWLVGLSFSISALRHARTALRREQARAFLVAFGMRDVLFMLIVVLFTFVPPTYAYSHRVFLLYPAVFLAYFPLVAYGILKHQLFDIDLRLKLTLQRSTVLGTFAGAFFVGSEALEELLPVEGFILGLAAAGGVTVAFRPLQKAAQRFADRALPGVDASAAYLRERKYVVYRDAVEAAVDDGTVNVRETAILRKLQQSLVIDPDTASAIEAEVLTALRSPSLTSRDSVPISAPAVRL